MSETGVMPSFCLLFRETCQFLKLTTYCMNMDILSWESLRNSCSYSFVPGYFKPTDCRAYLNPSNAIHPFADAHLLYPAADVRLFFPKPASGIPLFDIRFIDQSMWNWPITKTARGSSVNATTMTVCTKGKKSKSPRRC